MRTEASLSPVGVAAMTMKPSENSLTSPQRPFVGGLASFRIDTKDGDMCAKASLSLAAAAVFVLLALTASSASAAPGKPTIGQIGVKTVGATVTTLWAEIDPGGEDTTYDFEYGRTASYGAVAPLSGADAGGRANNTNVEQALSGLAPSSVYHYRVVATNPQGTVASTDKTFTTFGVASFRVSATNADRSLDFESGSHPYEVTTSFTFSSSSVKGEVDPAGALKDLELDLPPGLSGDPTAVPQCPQGLLPGVQGGLLGESQCPADTQVGLVSLELGGGAETMTLPLYNLVPAAGVPVEFGVEALLFPLTMKAELRPDRSYSLSVNIDNLTALFRLTGLSVTLWGEPADPGHDAERGKCAPPPLGGASRGSCPSGAPLKPFLTLPTACQSPMTFTLHVNSWAQPGEFLTAEATSGGGAGSESDLRGCEGLDFSPSISVQPETTAADSPAGLAIDLHMPYYSSPTGRAEADLNVARVALPPGVSINVAATDGLGACAAVQIGLETLERASCPGSSEIGSVELYTPLLAAPLVGSIYLGQPGEPFDGELTAYIVAEGDGIIVKLAMQLVVDPNTGQLSVSVDKVPQFAFTDLKLNFRGGPRAPLATPEGCGAFTTTSQLIPYSAAVPSLQPTLTSDFTIDANCGNGFAPSFVGGSTSAGAGESTGFTVQTSRADGEQDIRSLSATLPAGLLANLGSVSLCGAAQAAAGTCGAASEVGTVAIAAGAGSHPFYLAGTVFLTGPVEGAPFGLSIVVPAVAGPFNLGTVVIGARLLLDRHNARMTLVTDPLPTRRDGIPIRIRTLAVNVDRPGFVLNPTSCATQQVTAEIAGTQTTARVASPFTLTGCARLPFSPSVSASTQGAVSLKRGAEFELKIGEPRGTHANIRSIEGVFPSQLSARLKAVQHACLRATFDGNPAACPAESRIGATVAQTSLLNSPLSGPAYLVSNGTAARPQIAIVLQGDGVILELSGALKIASGNALTFKIDNVPDAPISSLLVSLPAGPASVLGANELSKATGSLCGKKLVLRTVITGQNGARVKSSPRVAVTGCSKTKVAKSRK